MQYVYEFDLAAVFIMLTLLSLFFIQRNFLSTNGKIFLGLIVWGLITPIIDIVSIYTINHPESIPLGLNYFVNILYFVSFNFVGVLYYLYVMHVTTFNQPLELDQYLVKYLFIMNSALIVTTPITKLIFHFDVNGTYYHGPLFFFVYINILIVLLRIIYLFYKAKVHLTKQQNNILRLFNYITLFVMAHQFIYPDLLLLNFSDSLFFLLIYITLENPDDYIDQDASCYNSIALRSALEHRTQKNDPFSLVFFQIDDYAYINQNMGNDAARAMLLECSEHFIKQFSMQRFFRLNANTFCILVLPNKKMTEETVFQKIQDYYDKPLIINQTKMRINIFCGAVRFPDFAITYDDFNDAIVYSLQELKRKEDKKPFIAQEDILTAPRREDEILVAIKNAIKQKSFQVFYQPIKDVAAGTFTTSEALVRLYDNSLGYIPPDEFIPMAEKNGMINDIGEQVFREVCRFLKEDNARQLGVKNVHVNLSTIQCMQENLAERLLEIMDEFGIAPDEINFEITETASLINEEILLQNMKTIIEAGSAFSMDDYGTGFSTADYLVHMPLNKVKIDKSILWSAMKDDNARTILTHTVSMLQELNKKIVVEGVENIEMAEYLIQMGCDYLQGYYYSKPISARDYIKFLKAEMTR